MNEETGNKPVELTDDEMDNVAGGKVAVLSQNRNDGHVNVQTCYVQKTPVHFSNF